MSLLIQIKDDSLTARKARDTVKALFLTTLLAEAAKVGKDDGNRDSTDEEVTATIKKFIKNTSETVQALDNAADVKIAARDQMLVELAMLKAYLPLQASEAEVKAEIAREVTSVKGLAMISPKQMGSVMAALNAKFAGNFDKKAASLWIKDALAH